MPKTSESSSVLFRIFRYTFYTVFIALLLSALISISGMFALSTLIQNIVVACMLVAAFTVYLFLRQLNIKPALQKFAANRAPFILGIGMVLLFAMQLIIVQKLHFQGLRWDVGMLTDTAGQPYLPKEAYAATYFNYFPNNQFLLFVYKLLFMLLDFVGIARIHGLIMLNVLMVDAAILITFFVCKRIYSQVTAYICYALCMLLVGIMPWIIIPYSDTLLMPFAIGLVLIYLKLDAAKNLSRKIACSVAIGLVFAIGFFIKPHIAVVIITIAIVSIIARFPKNKKALLTGVSCMLSVALVFAGTQGVFTVVKNTQSFLPINKTIEVPPIHWMTMGLADPSEGHYESYGKNYSARRLSGYGGYNMEDTKFTLEQGTTEKMREANWNKFWQRIQEKGFIGYACFLANKARWVFLDGTFFWGGEGDNSDFIENYSPPNLLKQIMYPVGQYNMWHRYFMQGLWILVLLFMVFPIFTANKKKVNGHEILLQCIIFGLLLFNLLFEGRSRYLIAFLPIFVVLAANGYMKICKAALQKAKRLTNRIKKTNPYMGTV